MSAENIKMYLGNSEEIINYRYTSSKIVFITFCLGYFISYYLISNMMFDDFLIKFLPFLYFGLITSLFSFVFCIIGTIMKNIPIIIMLIMCIAVVVLTGIFSIPILSLIF